MEMERQHAFWGWCMSRGVKTFNVEVKALPGKGLGLVAMSKIEPGAVILRVPTSALHTRHNLPKGITARLGHASLHCQLAADVALHFGKTYAAWYSVMPTLKGFEESMPICWPPSLQELLPQAAVKIVMAQQKKFAVDWDSAISAFPELDRQIYLHGWLLVNTRTFYYVRPGLKAPKDANECLCFIPFADYLNHAAHGCFVDFNPKGFFFSTDRTYQPGEEICISYGQHNNDLLLAEYGFLMSSNDWDTVSLDDVLAKVLSKLGTTATWADQSMAQFFLEDEQPSGVCSNTREALMWLSEHDSEGKYFIMGDEAENATVQQKKGGMHQIPVSSHKVLASSSLLLLEAARDWARDMLRKVEDSTEFGHPYASKLLVTRWTEIHTRLESSVARWSGPERTDV